jgi:hypothetical protein
VTQEVIVRKNVNTTVVVFPIIAELWQLRSAGKEN